MMKTDIQRQLAAAEKTNAILKSKVIELYNGGAQSTIHKQLERSKQRDEENRRKRELMEMRNQELKRYSEVLEGEVARRTEEMKSILDNVTFGFLVVDRNLRIAEECTRSCLHLFGRDRIGGESILDILNLTQREKEHFRLAIDQVFEDILPPEVTLPLVPQRYLFGARTLRLEGSSIRGKDGAINGILFSVSDISSLENAQREAALNKALLAILQQKDAFATFLVDAKALLNGTRKALIAGESTTARRFLHTVKGNAASYGLDAIASLIHRIEDLDEIKMESINSIEIAFRNFLKQNANILALDYDQPSNEIFEVTTEAMTQLKDMIVKIPDTHGRQLKTWAEKVMHKPATMFLGPLADFSAKLAERLGKSVSFEVQGGDLAVDGDLMRPILQGIIHLVRNSIDHGIELPDQRGDKPMVSSIKVSIEKMDGSYVVEVSDDGRGIDVGKLVKKAVDKGVISRDKASILSPKEGVQLIFVDGLSAADETTEISGRGVGMSAVLAEVRYAGGSFDVISEAGKGTKMILTVPFHSNGKSLASA